MEWLRKIIENAKIEDGKIDTEAVMKEVNLAFPKNAVPKAEFNAVNEQLKKANGTIKELEEAGEGNEELLTKVKAYEAEIERLNVAAENTKKEFVLKEQLSQLGVIDPDYLIYKNGGVEKFDFDKDGNPVGVDDVLNKYKQTSPVLFRTEETGAQHTYIPVGGGEHKTNNPFLKESFNLTEQGKMFMENPAQAKAFAQAAGVKI